MTNPLFSLDYPLPFDQILPEHIAPAIAQHITGAQNALSLIAAASTVTYENTFGALERATEGLETAMGIVENLESVATTDELRAAYNQILPKVSEFFSSIALHPGVYASLKRFNATLKPDDSESDLSGLEPTQRRFMKKTLEDFQRHGAELDDEGKQKLQEIDRALSEKTTAFSQNVLDGTNQFELIVDETRLNGLPDLAKKAARQSATDKGLEGYRLTLQAPAIMPVLTYAEDRSLREEMWRGFNYRGRAKNDNIPLVRDILRLRRKRAILLGFKNFADLVAEDRMAKTGKDAAAFVEDLRKRTQVTFEEENKALLAFRRELEGPQAPELEPWDVSYYAEKLRKKLYDFDEEQLRPYFSAPQVLKGAFELAQELYGIQIRQTSLPTWDKSVGSYEIVNEAGEVKGVFYTDLYPRENKRDGAWMHGLVAAPPPGTHVALFCSNAQPPTSETPSLMSFRDVETIFHEFGHLLHHCLSEVSVRGLSCTRVAQDFVELPSQIMENWCSEKLALDKFAHHYQTQEPLPDEQVQRLLAARNFRAANAQMRQLGFSAVDLALHVDFDPDGDDDLMAFANGVLQNYTPTHIPAEYALIASFSHLFSHPVGYAAGYYSYKWAEVLDADAFSRFKQEGLFNRKTGEEFRKAILSRGDSAEPLDLFKEFMGRAPNVNAMLERQGLSVGP